MVALMKDHLSYNPSTGLFTWVVPTSNRVKKGDPAGRKNNAGHIGVGFLGERWQAHRLAVAFVEGSLQGDLEIDHRDQIKDNNAYTNLRKATKQQNSFNRGAPKSNSSGIKGVSFSKPAGKWEGYVNVNGKKNYVGVFDNKEDCEQAVKKVREILHGEFQSD